MSSKQIKCRILHSNDLNKSVDNEKRTLQVALLTAVTMLAEIIAGTITGSMALLADGWHMGTHTFAMGIAWGAYVLARKYNASCKFSFGTGKFGILAGYTSSLMLGASAIWLIYESVERIFNPVKIDFSNAMLVTIVGLAVNVISVFMLNNGSHHHGHHHHEQHEHHHDHNFRAAYFHVLADAMTSVLALAALLCGRYFNWVVLDPVIGILGGVLILKWAWSLLRDTGIILLDGSAGLEITEKIRQIIEADRDSEIIDLHLWLLDSENIAGILSIISGTGISANEYHSRLKDQIPHLKHLSIEVHNAG